MIPLIPTLILAFVSFLSSAFVILRIVIPILPPHPLSRRVPPSEFGLPNFRSLSPADKSHIWLASLDLFALAIFVWQAVTESTSGPSNATSDPASAVRLWFSLSLRQTCLLIVAALTLLHVRMGRSVSFGSKHWMLWTPTLLVVVISTALAGVLAGTNVPSFFPGMIAFSSTLAILSSVSFACLIGTLIIIKCNLAALNEPVDSWPPAKMSEEKPRPSFGTEDIDAMREGSSWITSNASSRHDSISAWSFSTHHTATQSTQHLHPATASYPSIPPKSSFWFNPTTPYGSSPSTVPPVPPLPSPYRPPSPTAASLSDDPDPFRRNLPGHSARDRLGSQTSWLTSPSVSQVTLSAWSYPTTHQDAHLRADTPSPGASTPDLRAELLPSGPQRPFTPAMANAQVLGGYGYHPDSERGIAALAVSGGEIDVSIYRAIGWFVMIWVPLGLSLPYLITASSSSGTSYATSILLSLSVTLSSPLLALNIILRSPIPIPSGLFDSPTAPPSHLTRTPSPQGTYADYAHEYKRSGSVTVVEGRRSGDVWLSNGDAVDGKGKFGRAMGLLTPAPRLAVLPPDGEEMQDGEVTPPLPIQTESEPSLVPPTPQSENSAELGRKRKESKASSHYSGADESLAFATRIMVAQRHYSALATTVVVPASPEKAADGEPETMAAASGAAFASASMGSHLRARSITSFDGPQSVSAGTISPPPSFPLPPTPPSLKASRLAQLTHRKSFSTTSSSFSFGAVMNDDMHEIDALTAGVLPLLVPGLKVGAGMRVRESWDQTGTDMGTWSKNKVRRMRFDSEFGELSGPQVHSTPARKQAVSRQRKMSSHKRNHYSLPSLGLGKDGAHSLATEVTRALESRIGHYATVSKTDRRNTVWGGEFNIAREDLLKPVSSDPTAINSARSSLATLNIMPPSAASSATLFEFDSPDAESTPHNSVKGKVTVKKSTPPPLPTTNMTTKSKRRSSIIYIKSDNVIDENSPPTHEPPKSNPSSRPLAQWSSRVRPLIPKSSAVQRKNSSNAGKSGSPSGGLRPLSLLQDRSNTSNESLPVSPAGTRPLLLGKKHKQVLASTPEDENVQPEPRQKTRALKPLQLARSETSKLRGILRKEETLPNVVIRPPSQSEYVGFD